MTDNPQHLTSTTEEEGAALPPAQITFEGLNLHPQTIRALEAMAYEGLSLHLAAKKENIRPDNFTRAFNRPEVRRVYNQIVKAIKDNAATQAYVRNVNLAQSSNSDHVRADLNKWIAGVDGIAAVKRVEGKMHHTHAFGGFEYDEPEAVDITPEEGGSDIQSLVDGEQATDE
ncbi:hypothetical protein [Tritonibacter mobilis]|uniref:hypothetical protein n=1 Tax=Tritonibacter mobilis TaxID=379347 RepID=UPI000806EC52|nr:hypothetical protein [Tritonibacter mobilis]